MRAGQTALHERPVAAGRTVGDGDAGPRPPPRGGAGLLPWGRLGRLASPWSTLAPGACLAPVSQEAHMPQALAAVRPDLQEKTPGYTPAPPRWGERPREASPWAGPAHGCVASTLHAWLESWSRRGVPRAGDLRRAGSWAPSTASVRSAGGQDARHVVRQTGLQACTGPRTRGGVGTQRVPSSVNAPPGPRQWRWQGAWSVWSQVGQTRVAPR